MRILIVEDDALLGDGLASGLSSLGFVVDWFRTGEEADRAVAEAPYDAIVLDLGLPGEERARDARALAVARPERSPC